MTNDVNRMGLLALVIPLALFLSLSYLWSGPVGSESELSTQPQRPLAHDSPGENHGDVQTRGRLAPASASLGFTEADFARHVTELDAQIKKKLASPGSH